MESLAVNHKTKLTLVSPDIPAEVILRVVEFLPFNDGKGIASLRQVHPRLNGILGNYERSITRNFMAKELPHASTDFPCCDKFGFKCLADCVKRYDIVDDVMDALLSKENSSAIEPFNMALVHAGVLLLYCLRFMESHDARLAFIQSLPRDPLTAIYLALHHSTLTARYHGSGWLHQSTYGRQMDADQFSLRSELEFCFAEAALALGPEFIFDCILRPAAAGDATLLNFYAAFGTHDWAWPAAGEPQTAKGVFWPPRVHGPYSEAPPASLFTALLERLAALSRCGVDAVRAKTEDDMAVAGHPLVWLGLHGKARLLKGEDWV